MRRPVLVFLRVRLPRSCNDALPVMMCCIRMMMRGDGVEATVGRRMPRQVRAEGCGVAERVRVDRALTGLAAGACAMEERSNLAVMTRFDGNTRPTKFSRRRWARGSASRGGAAILMVHPGKPWPGWLAGEDKGWKYG